MVDDWVGEGDPLGWRFGTVLDEGDPTILLGEQSVSREERAGVSVRSHSEEDEVEDRVPSGIPLSEGGDQLTLVLVRELFRVREERDVDGVNLSGGDGSFREEEFVDGGEVGILVVQRDETFVAEEDFPRGGEERRQICEGESALRSKGREAERREREEEEGREGDSESDLERSFHPRKFPIHHPLTTDYRE